MNIMARENKSDSVLRETALGPCDATSQPLGNMGHQKSEVKFSGPTSPPLHNLGGPSLEAWSPYSTPPPLSHMGGPSLEAWSQYSTPPPLSHMGGPSVETPSPYSTPPPVSHIGRPSVETPSPYSTPPPVSHIGRPSVETPSPYSTPPPLSHMGGPSVETPSPYSTPPTLSDMGGPSVETPSPYSTPPTLSHMGGPSVETPSPYSTPPTLSHMGGPSVETPSPYSTPPTLSHMGGPSVETPSPYSTPPPDSHMGGPSLEAGSLRKEQRVPLSSHVLCAVRQKVISGRRARGEADIEVEFSTPVKHELTEEEKEKRARRKRQNREAQHRSRLKKKRGLSLNESELDSLTKTNSALQVEVEHLKQTVADLKRIAQDHIMSGQCVRLASQSGFHQHTDHHTERHTNQCTTGYVSECPDNHEDTPLAGLIDQYPAGQASSHAYSSKSENDGSPCPDHQVADMMDSQWMTTTGNLESFSVGAPANIGEPVYPRLTTEGCDARPIYQGDLCVQVSNRQHTDTITSSAILRNDAWVNVGVNRGTPDIPHDNAIRYSTPQASDHVTQEAEYRPVGEIGIPSLDNISLEQLIPANIDFSRYLPIQRD